MLQATIQLLAACRPNNVTNLPSDNKWVKTNFCPAFSEEWVRGLRDVPHAKQDTTGACEGFHSALKAEESTGCCTRCGMRCVVTIHMCFGVS